MVEGRGRRQLCLGAEASSLLATLGVSIVLEVLMDPETLTRSLLGRGHPQTNLEGRAEVF